MRERGESRRSGDDEVVGVETGVGMKGCETDWRRGDVGFEGAVVDQGWMIPEGSLQRSVTGEKSGPCDVLEAIAADQMS